MSTPKGHDPVQAPHYYTNVPFRCEYCGGVIEPLTIAQHLSFGLGNTLKYIIRAGAKTEDDLGIQDLEKAKFYIANEIRLRRKSLGEEDV